MGRENRIAAIRMRQYLEAANDQNWSFDKSDMDGRFFQKLPLSLPHAGMLR